MENFTEIIDTHCHVYPQKIAAKAVNAISEFYELPMAHDGCTETLLASGGKIGVSKYVIHSLATTPHQVKSINDFILENVKAESRFVGFATLHQSLTEEELTSEIDRVLPTMKGVKLHPDFQQFYVDDPENFKIYRAIDGRLPILFHAGDSRYSFSAPERIAKVCKLFPNQTVIAAHLGGYSCWDRIDVYKGIENVFFDTCSALSYLSPTEATKIIRDLGVERFTFATDFPMWDAEEELKRFMRLHLSDDEKEMILSKNAKRIIKI